MYIHLISKINIIVDATLTIQAIITQKKQEQIAPVS